jgi:hypothetical protein
LCGLRVTFAMNSLPDRTCRHCRRRFLPDYRNEYHQRFCGRPECQDASKRCSQRRWLRKPENRNYFREPDNALRVREWRSRHPHYWKPHAHACTRQEPPASAQAVQTVTSPPPSAMGTLQEVCRSKVTLLTCLVSRLSRSTLQEDIASCANQMLLEAQCILNFCQSGIPASQPGHLTVDYHETG